MKKQFKLISVSILTLLVVGVLTFASCQSKDVLIKNAILSLPNSPFNYTQVENGSFGNSTIPSLMSFGDESRSVFNDHTATLGRVLFYDTKMSINNTVSCGTCHKQSLGFADGSQFSTGFANKKTTRNSMSIINSAENNKMFWDSRAENPYELSLMPVFNHLEMGMESDEMLVKKISEAEYYPELFEKAYGSTEITKEKISKAVSCFINAMFSKKSKYDEGLKTGLSNFNAEEKLGHDLFNGPKFACSACHAGDNFNSQQYYNHFSNVTGTANIGLDKVYADQGADRGSFKIPGLRNVGLTGPYMHDGRYEDLEDVVRHYATGIQDNAQLDPRFRDASGQVRMLKVTEIEVKALVAFLNTLTDASYIYDPKFSNPFK